MARQKSSFIGKFLRGALVLVGMLLLAVTAIWAWGMPRAELRGQWQTEGYGIVADIGRFTIDLREVGPDSCERYQLAPANLWLLKTLGGIEFDVSGEGMVIRAAGAADPILTKRLDAMPSVCNRGVEPDTMDPEWNFEVYWNAFAERYTFFDLYGVDWNAVYAEYRPQITANTTQD